MTPLTRLVQGIPGTRDPGGPDVTFATVLRRPAGMVTGRTLCKLLYMRHVIERHSTTQVFEHHYLRFHGKRKRCHSHKQTGRQENPAACSNLTML